MDDSKLAISLDMAAQKLSVSRSAIYRLINAKQLRSVHIGGRHMIPIEALHALVQEAA